MRRQKNISKDEVGHQNGEAASYGNLGAVYLSLGEYEKATQYLEKSFVIQKKWKTEMEKLPLTETLELCLTFRRTGLTVLHREPLAL